MEALADSKRSIQKTTYMHRRIVVIDDDRDFADGLADYLRIEGGHDVRTFRLPEDALAWLVTGGTADIVLLDLRTPGMSAHRFRAVLMSVPALRDLPLIVISGLPTIGDVATAIGAAGFLQKPFDLDHLLAIIEHHCGGGKEAEPRAPEDPSSRPGVS
jgi:DNA-binding NtrC family response regulator